MRQFTAFLIGFLLLAALSLALPARYDVPYPKPLGPELAPAPRQSYRLEIEARRAEIVLLGDSMMQLGVDGEALQQALGRTVYRIAVPGSASAAWYLITRHNVVRAEPPPAALIVFFRDTILTAPGYRVHGSYYTDVVYENTAPDDDLFVQYAYIDRMSLPERLAERYLPLYGQRLDLRAALDARLRYTLPALTLGCAPDCADSALEEVFQANNMEPGRLGDAVAAAESYLYTPENLDFRARVERSFLPEMIRLTRQRGIRLILVRFKTLRFADSQPAALQAYMRDLRAYLAERDVPLLDYSADPRVLPEYYFDSLHMTESGRAAFTRILAEDLVSLIRP